ncbi:hypothetical protein MNBD_GAMMA01-1254 [hydrothermal vent metagenome]|uniref:Protein SlyX homolog n=1 Tax=hydrothermal vent metagenome TaxID=652676 RepID=A0A3B0V813_9ZZZZ
MQDTQDKIIELETKLAFLEETVEQLNDVIIDQQKAIDTLQRQFIQLNTKVEQESQHWNQESSTTDETPPHY